MGILHCNVAVSSPFELTQQHPPSIHLIQFASLLRYVPAGSKKPKSAKLWLLLSTANPPKVAKLGAGSTLSATASASSCKFEKALLRMFREGLDGFKGRLSAGKYSNITGASPATTTRDLADLVAQGALVREGEPRPSQTRAARLGPCHNATVSRARREHLVFWLPEGGIGIATVDQQVPSAFVRLLLFLRQFLPVLRAVQERIDLFIVTPDQRHRFEHEKLLRRSRAIHKLGLGSLAPRIRPYTVRAPAPTIIESIWPSAEKYDESADLIDGPDDLSDGPSGHKRIFRLIGE